MSVGIDDIRVCNCGARDGTPHVCIRVRLVGSSGEVERWPICIGPTEARATAQSLASVAETAGRQFDQAPVQPASYVGDPGVRDPEYPCETFFPGDPRDGNCHGDGHYMCRECIHLKVLTDSGECRDCGCPDCPGLCGEDECSLCTGAACRNHGYEPCACDVIDRHKEVLGG